MLECCSSTGSFVPSNNYAIFLYELELFEIMILYAFDHGEHNLIFKVHDVLNMFSDSFRWNLIIYNFPLSPRAGRDLTSTIFSPSQATWLSKPKFFITWSSRFIHSVPSVSMEIRLLPARGRRPGMTPRPSSGHNTPRLHSLVYPWEATVPAAPITVHNIMP